MLFHAPFVGIVELSTQPQRVLYLHDLGVDYCSALGPGGTYGFVVIDSTMIANQHQP